MNASPFFLFYFSLFMIVFFIDTLSAQKKDTIVSNSSLSADTLNARQLLKKEKALIAGGAYQSALDVLEEARILYLRNELWEAAINCVIRQSKLSDNFETAGPKIEYSDFAVKLARQHLSKEHPLLAAAFRQKAEALMMIEVLDSANYFLAQGVPILEKHEVWTELGWSEILLAVNYLNQYQLDSCQKHLSRVKLLLQNQKMPETTRADIQATYLELSGVLYQLQGDYDRAIENTQEALNIGLDKTEFSALDSFFIAGHFNNLGVLFLTKGDYRRALDNFMQSIHSSEDALEDQVLLYNIGELLIKQKKYKEAISYFKKSLLLTKPQKNEVKIDAFNGMGIAFRGLEKYDSTLYYCQQAMNIPGDYKRFITLSIIGNIYTLKAQPQKALEYINSAIKFFEKDSTASINSPFFISRLYHLLGEAHALNQTPNTALEFYQKALVVNHATFTDSLNLGANPALTGIYEPIYFLKTMNAKAKTLAAFTEQPAQLELALTTYQLTIQWIDNLQMSYSSEASQLDWSSQFKPIYEGAINVAYQLYLKTRDAKYVDLGFTFSEKSKNAILLEALKSNEGKSLADVPDSLVQREKDLNLDIAFYEKNLQKSRDQKEAAKEKLYQQYLSKIRLELVALKEQIEQDYPTFYDWKYGGETTSVTNVQSGLIDEHTAFLEYFIGDSTAYVFAISKQSATLLKLSTPARIKTVINNLRQVLSDPGSFEHNAKAVFNVYQVRAITAYQHLLIYPLATFPSSIQKLIIAPDDILNTIPFEALCIDNGVEANFDFATLPFLIYDYQLSYAYSADLLLKNKSRRDRLPANTRCLAFAPPYRGNQQIAQHGNLQQLRNATGQLEGTTKEIQQIAHFIDGQFDFGKTATEQQFKTLANQYGILHLAMHGVVDLDNANFNHLKFSDLAKDSIEDNLLHHYEIANMDLQAQLVVLSACETGAGKYEKGEGVFSLARSFMYAGAPSVVMSLWKVNDASTSQLMPYFYESLTDGQAKDAALHQAKLRFLQEANVEFRHPFYWSAFVLMGDVQVLKKRGTGFVWWGVGAFLFGLIGWWFWRKNNLSL